MNAEVSNFFSFGGLMIYNVWFSQNENPELSNLYPRGFVFETRRYISVEHAYQTLKSGTLSEFVYQHGNWKRGRTYKSRAFCNTDYNWNMKLMEKLVHLSFIENPQFIPLLENPSLPEIPVDSKVEFTHLSKYKSKDIWTVEFPRILTVIRNNILSEVN